MRGRRAPDLLGNHPGESVKARGRLKLSIGDEKNLDPHALQRRRPVGVRERLTLATVVEAAMTLQGKRPPALLAGLKQVAATGCPSRDPARGDVEDDLMIVREARIPLPAQLGREAEKHARLNLGRGGGERDA